jgi:hypothetical protein
MATAAVWKKRWLLSDSKRFTCRGVRCGSRGRGHGGKVNCKRRACSTAAHTQINQPTLAATPHAAIHANLATSNVNKTPSRPL